MSPACTSSSAFLSRFRRTRCPTHPGNVLRGSGFLSPYCFPQFANACSVVDFGSSLTIKARTVTIFSGHTVLSSRHTHMGACRPGFFLEVFDRHEEDSPGTNRRNSHYTIALTPYNSNTIYERHSLQFGLTLRPNSLQHAIWHFRHILNARCTHF